MLRLRAFVIALAAACASRTPQTATTPSSAPRCVTGSFVSAFEDDDHGVTVELSAVRTSATQYQPSSEHSFYVEDAGNPTRGLRAGDEVWLIQNEPASPWPWHYLSRDEARTRCPAG